MEELESAIIAVKYLVSRNKNRVIGEQYDIDDFSGLLECLEKAKEKLMRR